MRLSNASVFYFVSTALRNARLLYAFTDVCDDDRFNRSVSGPDGKGGIGWGRGEFYTLFETHNPSSAHTHTIVVTPKKILGETIKKSHNEVGD